MDLTSQNFC